MNLTASAETQLVRTRTQLRPRYEGANICTWIGFKHVNYLVEEAVLDHLRQCGHPAGELYERHGLCVDLTEIDTKMLTAFHIDDLATATVDRLASDGPGIRLSVTLVAERAQPVRAAVSKVTVVLRRDPRGFPAQSPPAELAEHVVERLGRAVEPVALTGADPLAQLTAGRNAFAWKWRAPYFYCHFTERVQMTGYLRLLEEAVDRFLADRGVSIKRLLDEQNWIPVVPRSQVSILDEAWMEQDLYVVFTVEDVFKRLTYTARMDCYVVRENRLEPVASGRITHGYAVIDSRRDWSQVDFDDRLAGALNGQARP
ncbi:thioesterase family protein [Kutzneria buriramensis]|uniref:Acyl-CoA thioesterase FadM n=1 Tax=Kutzneria buriramensis TaxID=1045776 RepID=A0A3E0HQG6_9PSEU|nr:thioesterase family protein [Kutzneria buriramensis]REH48486.1 acyl-CoA thioesterase FadM [Kutzneria buriramensis]